MEMGCKISILVRGGKVFESSSAPAFGRASIGTAGKLAPVLQSAQRDSQHAAPGSLFPSRTVPAGLLFNGHVHATGNIVGAFFGVGKVVLRSRELESVAFPIPAPIAAKARGTKRSQLHDAVRQASSAWS
jgi:hypothetical protein